MKRMIDIFLSVFLTTTMALPASAASGQTVAQMANSVKLQPLA